MKLSNIKLILSREMRDQLRDRRTMFMIFVLPILLYPLMGINAVQVSQFMQEKPTRVLVCGAQRFDDLPPLLENQRLAADLFAKPEKAKLLELTFAGDEPAAPDEPRPSEDQRREAAQRSVQSGKFEAALFFPDDYSSRLEEFRKRLRRGSAGESKDDGASAMPQPKIFYNTASEKSLVTFARLSEPWQRWTEKIVESNLKAGGVPAAAAKPMKVDVVDVAEKTGLRGAAFWAKILPILLVLWAMTGAFYPAVDLCAGEKERGTIETLLTSPATRSEIVVGKLLTIMAFSLVTAVFNLVSAGITGAAVAPQFPQLGPLPMMAIVWLPLALVPISALFSALCLALAAFARSTKEGQYYLMPLMIGIMPLVVLPAMSPSSEITLGTSLIPITGLVLLLRTLLEGEVRQALPLMLPVVAVTFGCCAWAVRWAVDQFNSESVLFRENERLDLALWLRHTIRDRQPTPSVLAAVLCCSVILSVKYFLSFSGGSMTCFADIVRAAALPILFAVLLPALLMTMLFTRSPRHTLLLRMPKWWTVPAAILLAVAFHPVATVLSTGVRALYPINPDDLKSLLDLERVLSAAPLWQLFLVMALMPAICEELTFRGFILSGFRHTGRKWRAIVLSSLVFGFTHGILQQSIIASLLGMILGYLAVQSGSIFPCMCFHFVHNGLMMVYSKVTVETVERWPILNALVVPAEDSGAPYCYRWRVVVCGAIVFAGLLAWFSLARYEKSDEEEHNETIESHRLHPHDSRVGTASEMSNV